MDFLSWVLGGLLFLTWTIICFSLGVMGGRESERQEHTQKQREFTRRMNNVGKN